MNEVPENNTILRPVVGFDIPKVAVFSVVLIVTQDSGVVFSSHVRSSHALLSTFNHLSPQD